MKYSRHHVVRPMLKTIRGVFTTKDTINTSLLMLSHGHLPSIFFHKYHIPSKTIPSSLLEAKFQPDMAILNVTNFLIPTSPQCLAEQSTCHYLSHHRHILLSFAFSQARCEASEMQSYKIDILWLGLGTDTGQNPSHPNPTLGTRK